MQRAIDRQDHSRLLLLGVGAVLLLGIAAIAAQVAAVLS
jgi:hypothetical protein